MNQRAIIKTLFVVVMLVYGLLLYHSVPDKKPATDPLAAWQKFETSVRDGSIDKSIARRELPVVMAVVENLARHYSFTPPERWVFPVAGYSLSAIGGKNGNDYQPDIIYGVSPIKGYDFFDGNRHGGHPAHDIFIRDNNQDCLDDRTHKPVAVVATVDGLVLGTYTGWYPASQLRGGNVIWLYNPRWRMLFYYAHLDKVMVKPGQFLKAGEVIGTIGRTGFSAYKKTSPTHLHLMVLQYQGNKFKPYNYYSKLTQNLGSGRRY